MVSFAMNSGVQRCNEAICMGIRNLALFGAQFPGSTSLIFYIKGSRAVDNPSHIKAFVGTGEKVRLRLLEADLLSHLSFKPTPDEAYMKHTQKPHRLIRMRSTKGTDGKASNISDHRIGG